MISGTTQVTSPIAPTSTVDIYATHDAFYGKDGLRNVASLVERNSIPTLRRKAGMLVGVLADDSYWRLKNITWDGTDNDWEEFNPGGSSTIGLNEIAFGDDVTGAITSIPGFTIDSSGSVFIENNLGIVGQPISGASLYINGKAAATGHDAIRVDSLVLGPIFVVNDFLPRVAIGALNNLQGAAITLGSNSGTQHYIGFGDNSTHGRIYNTTDGLRLEYLNTGTGTIDIFMSTDSGTYAYMNSYVSASFSHNVHIGHTPGNPYDFNNTVRFYVRGVDDGTSHVLRLDNQSQNQLVTFRNDGYGVIKTYTKYLDVVSDVGISTDPSFIVRDVTTGNAFKVDGYYGRISMGIQQTDFNNTATLNIASWGLGRFLYLGQDGRQMAITETSGDGVNLLGKNYILNTNEFSLISDSGYYAINNNTTAGFMQNVSIGAEFVPDPSIKLFVAGPTDSGEKLLTLRTTSGLWDVLTVRQGIIESRVNNFTLKASGIPGAGANPTLTLHDEVGGSPSIIMHSDLVASDTFIIAGNPVPRFIAPYSGRMWFDTTNVGIGLIATLETKLYIQGTDSTTSNYSLKIDDIGNSSLFYVRNDGLSSFKNGDLTISSTAGSAVIDVSSYKGLTFSMSGSSGNYMYFSHNVGDITLYKQTTIVGSPTPSNTNTLEVGNSGATGVSSIGVRNLSLDVSASGFGMYAIGKQGVGGLYGSATMRFYYNPVAFGGGVNDADNNYFQIGIGTNVDNDFRVKIADGLHLAGSNNTNTINFQLSDLAARPYFTINNEGAVYIEDNTDGDRGIFIKSISNQGYGAAGLRLENNLASVGGLMVPGEYYGFGWNDNSTIIDQVVLFSNNDIVFCTGSNSSPISGDEAMRIKANGEISMSALPTSNTGLSTGDLYIDTAANILANGDKVVGIKV